MFNFNNFSKKARKLTRFLLQIGGRKENSLENREKLQGQRKEKKIGKSFFIFSVILRKLEAFYVSSGSLATLLSHFRCDGRLHVDRLHVRRANDVTFWGIANLFLGNNPVDF
jgi:hypothetical protein